MWWVWLSTGTMHLYQDSRGTSRTDEGLERVELGVWTRRESGDGRYITSLRQSLTTPACRIP
jgi:hypothetical protein